MNHPCHAHALVLASPNLPYKCSECKELGFGQCYCCAPCDLDMHEECARTELYAPHPFDNGPLEYRAKCKLKNCDACGKSIRGSRYRRKLDWMSSIDFHPCCLKMQRRIVCEGIELHLVDKVSSKCLSCGQKSVSLFGTRGWSYESSCGNFCYHVACVKDSILKCFDKGLLGRRGHRGRSTVASSFPAAAQQQNPLVRPSRRAGNTNKFIWKIVVKTVFNLVISAIFGDPTTVVSSVLIESLCSN